MYELNIFNADGVIVLVGQLIEVRFFVNILHEVFNHNNAYFIFEQFPRFSRQTIRLNDCFVLVFRR